MLHHRRVQIVLLFEEMHHKLEANAGASTVLPREGILYRAPFSMLGLHFVLRRQLEL
jgi:hypothetical protein